MNGGRFYLWPAVGSWTRWAAYIIAGVLGVIGNIVGTTLEAIRAKTWGADFRDLRDRLRR